MAEAAEMEREIHRMRLRADALQRQQEKLIKDMELAIDKREMISIKVKAKTASAPPASAAAAPLTQVSHVEMLSMGSHAVIVAVLCLDGVCTGWRQEANRCFEGIAEGSNSRRSRL